MRWISSSGNPSATQRRAMLYAFLAAASYALSSPFSKLLLNEVPEILLAGFLYLGAGLGMVLLTGFSRLHKNPPQELSLDKKDLPYVVAMVLLDILAPILLLLGLKTTAAANVSLLNNFEIVATTLLARQLFQEKISRSLGWGIFLITLSTLLLSFSSLESFSFSWGSVLVLLACLSWGLENNCTRMISSKDTRQIVLIKGLGSGTGSLLLGLFVGEQLPRIPLILGSLLLGLVAYGLSVYLYVRAQRDLGASRTSAYYAVAPFIGVVLSILIFRELPSWNFWLALLLMLLGTRLTHGSEDDGAAAFSS